MKLYFLVGLLLVVQFNEAESFKLLKKALSHAKRFYTKWHQSVDPDEDTDPKFPECAAVQGTCMKRNKCVKAKESIFGICGDDNTVCCVFDEKADRFCSGRKGPCFARCQMKNTPCGSKGKGQFVKGLCSGPGERQCCVPYGMKKERDSMRDKDARKKLLKAGITFRDRCKDRLKWRCISLETIKKSCVDALIAFKEIIPDCIIRITGGTETGKDCRPKGYMSDKSSWTGNRIRISRHQLDKCATKRDLFAALRYRPAKGPEGKPRWEDGNGNFILKSKRELEIVCN